MLFVLVLAPVTAEYLIGYDDTLTNPAALIFGVLFFGPLYGAPAVLIREVARRTGRGWSAILLLGCAFGLIQAGLIDQSLFDPSYRDISFWPSLREPTFLAPLGTSAFMLVSFVGGHVFGSIAAPIGLAEACWPRLRDRPWLGWRGSALMGVLWLLGALFVLDDQLGSTLVPHLAGRGGLDGCGRRCPDRARTVAARAGGARVGPPRRRPLRARRRPRGSSWRRRPCS